MPSNPAMKLSASDLGRIGEKTFSAACSKLGITCNSSTEDDNGWDFLIEWPSQAHRGSADTAPDRFRALVQVKTTKSKKPVANLKLSAALSLTKAALPAFVVLVRVGHGGDPVSFALIHMWEKQIGQTLAAVRRAERDGKPLHRQKIAYRSDQIFDDATLAIEAMHADIAAEEPGYSSTKTAFGKDAGYDAMASEMKVTFDLDSQDDLIDWSLGLGEGLPVRKLDAWITRFGVTLPDRRLSGSSGRMFIEPTGSAATLQFRLPDGSSFSESVEIIASALPGLPSDKQRFRIKCDMFDFVIGGVEKTTFDLNADPEPDERQTLVRIARIAKLRSFDNGSRIALTLFADGRSQSLGSIAFTRNTPEPYWPVIAAGVPILIDISAMAPGEATNTARLSDIFEHRTMWALDVMAKLVGSNSLQIEFDTDAELEGLYQTLRGYFAVPVGADFYHALIERAVMSDTTDDDGGRQITCGPAIVRDALVTRAGQGVAPSVHDYFNSVVDDLPEPGTALYIGDFGRLLNGDRQRS